VLAAIQFDNELRFDAGEVSKVAVDWQRPAKLAPVELTIAHDRPQSAFSVGLIAPQ
jgi:hypothetical protein